jgi:enterochelin esterase-like enzyme
VFFLLLVVAFAVAIWRAVVSRRLALRIAAGLLAFLPAMLFGVAAVNKYYDYYQTWGSAWADIFSQGPPAQVAAVPGVAGGTGTGALTGAGAAGGEPALARFLRGHVDVPVASQFGYTVQVSVHGTRSGITRVVWVYLPPQYFQPSYAPDRFPVIELLHGFPGSPRDWVNVVGITTTLRQEIQAGKARPAVLVMPDVNGGRGISLQCLNQAGPGGPKDATYLGRDLPAAIAGLLRVQPPGPAWAVAGYSEGGFCAAELGLRFGRSFGYAGVLSGYFAPLANQLGSPPRPVSPYGQDRALKRLDTPSYLVTVLPATRPVPQFWIGAGAGDRQDVTSAQYFAQLLQIRQGKVAVHLISGGGHSMFTWRGLVPSMLSWMTPRLTKRAEIDTRLAARHEAEARKRAEERQKRASAKHHRHHHHHARLPPATAAGRPA